MKINILNHKNSCIEEQDVHRSYPILTDCDAIFGVEKMHIMILKIIYLLMKHT
jgi:hypothetical protein